MNGTAPNPAARDASSLDVAPLVASPVVASPVVASPLVVVAATAAALCGFAANSLLCRGALAGGSIDAVTFTAVRLAAGALVLAAIAKLTAAATARRAGAAAILAHGTWLGAAALFAYAIAFSLAYVRLTAGTGALVLFGCVQATMIGRGLLRGERPRPREWLGLGIAIAGLVALQLPGATAPDPLGFALMATAGVAWGVYSLHGRGVRNPLLTTAGNFLRAVPFGLLAAIAAMLLHTVTPLNDAIVAGRGGTAGSAFAPDATGLVLAAASGALASGLGYAAWYAALPHLTAMRAATVQLAVPVVAAAAGVLVLGESMPLRVVLAGGAVLGGVALAVLVPRR